MGVLVNEVFAGSIAALVAGLALIAAGVAVLWWLAVVQLRARRRARRTVVLPPATAGLGIFDATAVRHHRRAKASPRIVRPAARQVDADATQVIPRLADATELIPLEFQGGRRR